MNSNRSRLVQNGTKFAPGSFMHCRPHTVAFLVLTAWATGASAAPPPAPAMAETRAQPAAAPRPAPATPTNKELLPKMAATPSKLPIAHPPASESFPFGPTGKPLFGDRIRLADPRQGASGDCYFIAAMAAVAQRHPELIQNAFKENADGTLEVRLFAPKTDPATGERSFKRVVTRIDRTVPLQGGLPKNATGRTNDWPAMLEKAYAAARREKLDESAPEVAARTQDPNASSDGPRDGYEQLHSGYLTVGLEMITGKPAERVEIGFGHHRVAFERIAEAVHAGKPVLAATRDDDINARLLARKDETSQRVRAALLSGTLGLVRNHAYTILGVGHKDGKDSIVLREPGTWIEPAAAGLGKGPAQIHAGGVFALPADEFALLFGEIAIGE
jgi:hypothetical protein